MNFFYQNLVFIFFINLLVTILIYVIPVIVYRFAIKKTALEDKKALKIAMIYSAILCVMFYFIKYYVHYDDIESGAYRATFGLGAALTWGFVNYQILKSGKSKETKEDKENSKIRPDIERTYIRINQVGEHETFPADGELIEINPINQKEQSGNQVSEINSSVDNAEMQNSDEKLPVDKHDIKPNRSKIITIILGILIVLLIMGNISQYIIYKQEINSINDSLDEKALQISNMNDKVAFLDFAVVVVPDDGTNLYHQYGCNNLTLDKGYWVYNSEAAIYEGYKPCSLCIGN